MVYGCSSIHHPNHFVNNLEGEWVWTDGTDSIWVEIKNEITPSLDVSNDTSFVAITGRYNLYKNTSLITGNHRERTIYGFAVDSKNQEVLVTSQPDSHYSDKAYVNLRMLSKNKLRWTLSDRIYIGGIKIRSPNDPPFPKPILGFKLPDNIVLTRLKK